MNDGALPQLPAGILVIAPLNGGAVDCAASRSSTSPASPPSRGDDPEPEFVDVNDGRQGRRHPAGEQPHRRRRRQDRQGRGAFLRPARSISKNIDTKKDGKIELTRIAERRRCASPTPCTGSTTTASSPPMKATGRAAPAASPSSTRTERSPTNPAPASSTRSLRSAIIPESATRRASRPKASRSARFGSDKLIFVGSERASVVGVYRDTGAAPRTLQVLPAGIGPEGLLAIPARNLFVAASETDLHGDGGVAPHVMIYQRAERAAPAYPTIVRPRTPTACRSPGARFGPRRRQPQRRQALCGHRQRLSARRASSPSMRRRSPRDHRRKRS